MVQARLVRGFLAVVLFSGWPTQDHTKGPNLAIGSPGFPLTSHFEKCRSIWSCPIRTSTVGSAAGSENLLSEANDLGTFANRRSCNFQSLDEDKSGL